MDPPTPPPPTSVWVLWLRQAPPNVQRYVYELTLHVNVRYNFAEMSWCLLQDGPCLQKMDGRPKREGGEPLTLLNISPVQGAQGIVLWWVYRT